MKKIFFFFSLVSPLLMGQIYMMGVAPLKPGNYWKYVDIGGYPFGNDVSCFFVTDSTRNLLGLNFNIVQSFGSPNYIRYSGYKMLTTDSAYIKYTTYTPDSIYTFYKANCKLGEIWVQPVNEFATYTYTVIDTFHITAWGNSYFSKLISVTDSNVTFMSQVWADHIGLLEEQCEGQYHMILVGCVIDGIVYGDTTTIVSVEYIPENPISFQLSQNYPNPFNPSTKISWQSPVGSWQTLKVYDILGKEVATLVDEYRNAGSYEVEFQSASGGSASSLQLASGIYYYQLKAGDFIETKKMILLK